jgi:hypothetical protein
MNRSINFLLLVLFILLSKQSFCDVIPNNSHSVEKCVKIIYQEEYPDFLLLATVQHPGGGAPNCFLINSGKCLEKGYKFNRLTIYAARKEYLKNEILDSLDWNNDDNILKSSIHIESEGGYEDNSNPVSSIEEYYKISGFTDSTVILYKCKELISFSDGRPLSLKTFNPDGSLNMIETQNAASTKIAKPVSASQLYPGTVVYDFLKALMLTILIESLILFIIFNTWLKAFPVSNNRLLFTGIICSFATLPYVWFVLPVFIKPQLPYVIVAELSVMIIEAFIIRNLMDLQLRKALFASVLCNVCSFIIGLLINML